MTHSDITREEQMRLGITPALSVFPSASSIPMI
jgi:hypothetical protein